MTTPPDKTGDKGPKYYDLHEYDFVGHKHWCTSYVRQDIYDALQSANAELVRQVEELKGEIASIKEMDAEMYDLQSDLQQERDRYRDALEMYAQESVDGPLGYDLAREALSPTTNKAEGG